MNPKDLSIPDYAKNRGIKQVLISEREILDVIEKMAKELDAEYADDRPLVICVLRGAVAFMSDLVKAMTIPLEMDFMAISSYGSSTKSSGVVRILKDLDEQIDGRRLIVVEDIVDSGLTLQYLLDHLGRRNPRDIRVIKKEKPDSIDVQVDHVGFIVPDEFVVGYGLDYAGEYRNLPFVGVLHPSVHGGVGNETPEDDA
jgi:hypoxanthine phosphoribosyltransferase